MKRPRREGRHGAESLRRTKTLQLPTKRRRYSQRCSFTPESIVAQRGRGASRGFASRPRLFLSVGDIFFKPNSSEISTLADLQPLASCPRLKRLDLRGNPVTQTADVEAELGQLLPSVTELLL